MADVTDIYRGILKPGGGIFEPGPPVMLPPQGMDKGAAITQALIASSMDDPGLGPSGGGGDPWGGFQGFRDDTPYDVRTMAQIGAEDIPHAEGTMVADKGQDRLPAGAALAFGDGAPISPAQQAIAAALLSPAGLVAAGPALGGTMQWSPAVTGGAALGGDPWANDRYGEVAVAQPGMVTGGRIVGFAPQQVGHRPQDLASGNPAIHDNQVETYTKRQAQLADHGTFTGHSGQVFKPGEKVRTTTGKIKTVQDDGSIR